MQALVVVSGLPASGKTTLAASLAHHLRWPHLDKDAMLEALFLPDDAPSLSRRAALSRQADGLFRDAALRAGSAVLSSWWRHPLSTTASGTPTDWLERSGLPLVEVHCQCPPTTALRRFLDRQRHEGHADSLRNRHELEHQFAEASGLGPLFPERAIAVSTVRHVEQRALEDLARRIAEHVSAQRHA